MQLKCIQYVQIPKKEDRELVYVFKSYYYPCNSNNINFPNEHDEIS